MGNDQITRPRSSTVLTNQNLTASAHKRNKSSSAVNMTKMAVSKRAFGVDVSNARKDLNNGQTVGYKKNIENVNPNVGAENVQGFNAPDVRPSNGGTIATKTQQVSLNTAKPATGSVAQATYPVNGAQVARPRALSKRAINNTVFRDEENAINVLASIETEGAPAPPAHQASFAPRQAQSQPILRAGPSIDGNAGEVVNNKALVLVDDELSPALARLSVSPSESASPSQKLTIPTSEGGEEVWDTEVTEHTDDELDQGYASGHDNQDAQQNVAGGFYAQIPLPNGLFSPVHERMLQVAHGFVMKAYTQKDAEDDRKDITMAAEYADEIFAHMNEVEVKNIAPDNYMAGFQTEVKPDMRRVLMDWVIQVHQRFTLLPETLYLCTNYIDRFLASKVVSLGKLQLVGATAILLAAKIEEVNPPTIPEIVYMVDDTYGADEVIKAERFMLNQLGWEMQFPGPMSFLRRISKADDYDIEIRTLAKYIMEVALMDYRFVSVPPSFSTAGAVCLARFMLNKGRWTPAHAYYSGYTGDQLYDICNVLLSALRMGPLDHHSAVYEKYSHRRYNSYSVRAREIILGTHTGRPFQLPMVLDDGQLFDYQEPCDGVTAYWRANTMAELNMTVEHVSTIIARTQEIDAQMRRHVADLGLSPVPAPASFNPYPAPNRDEVSA